jgi:two-component system nitrate/nitrite response regulator NarL
LIRILVLSEIKLYRESVAAALARFPRYEAIERPLRTRDAIATIVARSPQIALIDVRAPDGFSMIERIRARAPRVIRIALGVREEPDEIIACAEAGASSYLVQDASISDLAEAIDAAVDGRLRCSARIAQSLFAHVGHLAVHRKEANGSALTGREREILSLIERGKSNKTIALDLGIEVSTVKNHIHSLLGKLGVGRRGEAAALCRKREAAPPGRARH